MHPSECEDLVAVEVQLVEEASEDAHDLVSAVGLVARGHRRVGREDEFRARLLDRVDAVGGRRVRPGRERRGHGERRERGVPLVQVVEGRLDPHRVEGAHRADPEQRVLRQPDRRVALVEARGDPPLKWRVLAELCVEQEQRDSADLDAPDVRGELAVPDRYPDREGRAVRRGHAHRRHHVRVRLDPVLLLPAGAVHALVEVAPSVEEPDAHERQRLVGRLLEQVAG